MAFKPLPTLKQALLIKNATGPKVLRKIKTLTKDLPERSESQIKINKKEIVKNLPSKPKQKLATSNELKDYLIGASSNYTPKITNEYKTGNNLDLKV